VSTGRPFFAYLGHRYGPGTSPGLHREVRRALRSTLGCGARSFLRGTANTVRFRNYNPDTVEEMLFAGQRGLSKGRADLERHLPSQRVESHSHDLTVDE
jgi:hypothetical protein